MAAFSKIISGCAVFKPLFRHRVSIFCCKLAVAIPSDIAIYGGDYDPCGKAL